ncbi:hypothetical protein C8R45DRAFT_936467 [Mycena sanguinolenta]|nr:hypothetical protein C8R45DRAFT_936467 [Mycena sanguinolenta]
MPPDAYPTSKHTPADQEYLDSLSARQLMEFRNHARLLFFTNPKYIEMNAAKFLDHEWIDIVLLKEYLGHASAPLDALSSRVPIHVKIEAPVLTVKAKSTIPRGTGDVEMRTIAENFHEILSDSESDTNFDLELMEALQRNSRSSSAIPLSSEFRAGDLDSELEAIASSVVPLPSDVANHNEHSQSEDGRMTHPKFAVSFEEFSAFVCGLGIRKISDWWRHKVINPWIIPCLVKSQSLIPAEVWDSTPSTTKTNEAQHHGTNTLTGIKLTPVEAVESRRKVDMDVADEINMSLRTGILANGNNDMSHRRSKNWIRTRLTSKQ